MKPSLYLFLFLFTVSLTAQKNIHHRWNSMLQTYVSDDGKVNYKDWMNDRDNLDAYIQTLASTPLLESDSKNAKLAYWINAYNALTVQLILKHYPLKSIKEIKQPWDTTCFSIGEKSYTLGDIEHKILRKMDEPRIHFAINCASASCPTLWNKAFQEKQMESQLTEVTQAFFKDKSKNEIQPKQLKLSRIFLWFGKDFGSKKERLDFIAHYSGISLSNPKIDYLPYDWNLNE
jgi:hypothetical protein